MGVLLAFGVVYLVAVALFSGAEAGFEDAGSGCRLLTRLAQRSVNVLSTAAPVDLMCPTRGANHGAMPFARALHVTGGP